MNPETFWDWLAVLLLILALVMAGCYLVDVVDDALGNPRWCHEHHRFERPL